MFAEIGFDLLPMLIELAGRGVIVDLRQFFYPARLKQPEVLT
jgi:hypothetical protein